MPKRGLTKESVLDAAEELVTQYGADSLTTGALAAKLGIKPASLYNHMESTEELKIALAMRAIHALADALTAAAENRTREEAIYALADAYRTFVQNAPGLYQLILMTPMSGDGTLTAALPNMVRPIVSLLDQFTLTEEEKNHWQRVLRTVMHGFSTQELWGYFSHNTADRDESYRLAVRTVLTGILNAEQHNRHSQGGNGIL